MGVSSRLSLLALSAIVGCLAVAMTSVHAQSSSEWVNLHNSVRRAVGVGLPPVSWHSDLAHIAFTYAKGVATNCGLRYPNGPFGANAYWGQGNRPVDAVNWWWAERQFYHYNSNTCDAGRSCRHYKQLVWRTARSIGCARAQCNGGGSYYMVCLYTPRSNLSGRPY